jgi:hypothetical protein
MNEGKKAVKVLKHFVVVWQGTADPFPGGRLVLHVRVRRVYREDTLSSCNAIRSSLIAVVKVNAKDLCKAMAYLGGCSSHGSVPGGGRIGTEICVSTLGNTCLRFKQEFDKAGNKL